MIIQVKRFLCKSALLNLLQQRHICQHSGRILYPLVNRKVLKVGGSDAAVYLQGLITNDMRHFEDGAKSMYAMFLNNKGKVLYDSLIHKLDEDYIVECDKSVASLLEKHLKMFKLKRQITIEDVSQKHKLWVLLSDKNTSLDSIDSRSQINIYKDPRLTELGHRILTSPDVDADRIKGIIGDDIEISNSDRGYKYIRYKLGVSEGSDDLPPGSSFPLEVNCDYLHGVSFHKGCYIGQELTARVHHTGVVRKRIMPIKFTKEVVGLKFDSVISTKDNSKLVLGKLKGFVADYGLGLIRIKEALESNELVVGDYNIEVIKPTWWPIEAPKEKAASIKLE